MEVEYPKRSPSNPIETERIQQAINKGVDYLQNHQYPNGEFCCYYSPDDAMQEWCVPDSSIFPTALINTCLLSIKDHQGAKEIFKRSICFFQYQMMRGGVMNYFTKWSSLFTLLPPDIDDTIFVHSFLKSQNIKTPDPSPLILINRSRNGLFYTWFTLRFTNTLNKTYWKILLREFKNPIRSLFFWKHYGCSRNDIDGVVNANVLAYFGLNDATKPIINYLLDILNTGKESECDNWYLNPLTFYYPLARNIKNGIDSLNSAKPIIINRILKYVKPDGRVGDSALETALAITTFINLNYNGEQLHLAAFYLIDSQKETGEWPRWIYYYGDRNKTAGFGSEELTTGFCIEALAKYREFVKT